VQKQEPAGIEPQFEQADGGKLTMLQGGEIRPEPQEALALCRAGSQRRYEPGSYSLIARYGRKNLMKRAFEDSAVQAGIGQAMP
jgi:hypothetical protein